MTSKQRIDKLTLVEARKLIIMMYGDLCYASGVLDGLKVENTYIGDRILTLDEMLFTSEVEKSNHDSQ